MFTVNSCLLSMWHVTRTRNYCPNKFILQDFWFPSSLSPRLWIHDCFQLCDWALVNSCHCIFSFWKVYNSMMKNVWYSAWQNDTLGGVKKYAWHLTWKLSSPIFFIVKKSCRNSCRNIIFLQSGIWLERGGLLTWITRNICACDYPGITQIPVSLTGTSKLKTVTSILGVNVKNRKYCIWSCYTYAHLCFMGLPFLKLKSHWALRLLKWFGQT